MPTGGQLEANWRPTGANWSQLEPTGGQLEANWSQLSSASDSVLPRWKEKGDGHNGGGELRRLTVPEKGLDELVAKTKEKL